MKDVKISLLEFLSFDAKKQIAYAKSKAIDKSAAGLHQIATDYTSLYIRSQEAYKKGRINLKILNEIKKLDDIFLNMDPNSRKKPYLWTYDAMENSLKWKRVRIQAKKILHLMN